MNATLSLLESLALPAALVIAAVVVGRLLERLAMRRVKDADASSLRGRMRVLDALRGAITLWCAALGLYLAAELTDLPPAFARVVPKILLVVLIGSISWTAGRAAAGFVGAHASMGRLPSATLVANLVRLTVLVLGLLVLLQTLGISITPLITALGVGGLAVALALQDTFANLFAGVHVLLSRQVRTGDFVKLESGQEGTIEDVTWHYTTVRQLGGSVIIVPNAKLASAITTNFNRPDLTVRVPVGAAVSYGEDLDRVEEIVLEVAREVLREVPGGVPSFAPYVRFHTFGEHGVKFDAVLLAEAFESQFLVKHQFMKRIHRRFRDEGIEVPGARGGVRNDDDSEEGRDEKSVAH